ncbi:hypothetical protein Gotur_015809 [Gossypium turneri]
MQSMRFTTITLVASVLKSFTGFHFFFSF